MIEIHFIEEKLFAAIMGITGQMDTNSLTEYTIC